MSPMGSRTPAPDDEPADDTSGAAGVEAAARAGGHEVTVPFRPGRTDATAEEAEAVVDAIEMGHLTAQLRQGVSTQNVPATSG